MVLRILASFVLLFSILFMPFGVSVILALALMAYFPFFFEAVFLFLFVDALYGAREEKFSYDIFISFITALIIFLILEFLKSKLRLNKNDFPKI